MVKCLVWCWAAALVLTVSCGAVASHGAEPSKLEVWALIRNSDPAGTLEKLAANPAIDGIVYYTGLSKVAVAEGQYDWGKLDAVVAACRAADKPLKISLNGGRWSPEWIYAKGAQKFSWQHTTTLVDAGRYDTFAPVPWDPVYLGMVKAAARAAGERYGNEPVLKEVQITGPALANGLEINLVVTPEQARDMGFTPEKLAGAWKEMTDAYAAAFPKQKLALAMHDLIAGRRQPQIAREVRGYAQEKLGGDRLRLLVCYATHEDWFKRGNAAVDIWAEVAGQVPLEAQLIDIYSVKKLGPENVAAAMQRVKSLGASRVEIFSADLTNDAYLQAVTAAK